MPRHGFRAPVVVVGHSCVLSWWEAVLHDRAPASFDRYRAAVTRGLAAADAVIAPTATMLNSLERRYGPLQLRAVVPIGVPDPPAGRCVARERAVLAAGRVWDRAKNVAALARVAPAFAGPVRVAGCDRRPDGSRRTLPHVETLGWLEPVLLGRAMQAAAIFAHPARYQPFGLAPDDDDALAAALNGYAHDEDLRLHDAERAAARAATFTPQRMIDGTLAVYERLLGATPVTAQELAKGRVLPSCA